MSMIEDRLRAAARAAADTIRVDSAPPLRLDGVARRRRPGGSGWHSRGRIVRLVTPLAAAAAVIAVIGTAVSLGGGRQPDRHQPSLAPRQFNPLVPFADFGWLPPERNGVVSGEMWQSAEELRTGPDITLSVFPRGVCARGRQSPVTRQILTCDPRGAAPGEAALIRITGRAPDIHGLRAYWGVGGPLANAGITNQPVLPMIAFQYTRGGWALLHYPLRRNALRMARTVRFGLHTPVRFGAQLRNGLRQWEVSFASFTRSPAGFDGDILLISDRGQTGELFQDGSPWLGVFRQPTLRHGKVAALCPFNEKTTPSQVVNGYRVAVQTGLGLPPIGGKPGPYQDVCTPDADGLFVEVEVDGSHPPLTAVQVFGRLKLLGPDPANWTTRPLR